jgi:hypothetical protein
MRTAAELYSAYEDYSKTLRTWLVAYGVGAPVLFLTNERVSTLIAKSGLGRPIALMFLIGVALRILLAVVNKTAMWTCYYGEQNPDFKARRRWKVADWVSEQFWFDFAIDGLTVVLFSWATWCAFNVLLASP